MADEVEYRCFVGNLSWSTSDRGLKAAFEKFGNLLEAKVVIEKETGRSRGFGFVTFDEKLAMDKAIEAMNGIDLDGRNITVDRSSSNQGSGRDYDDNRSRDRNRGRDHDRGRDFGRGRGGGGGGGGGECFKCGKPGHFARECPSDGASGGRYGGKDDRYGGRDDRYGGKDDRYGGRDDRYGGSGGSRGGSRYGPDRNGDRFCGRNRDNGGHGGGDRYGRERAGPYDRRGAGGY